MSEKRSGSSVWWPKRVFNWSMSSPHRESPQTSPSRVSSNSSQSESDSKLSKLSNEMPFKAIISGVSDNSRDIYSNNKYINLFVKRFKNRFQIDGNESIARQYWMPDSNAKECYECGEKFNTVRRRHHCRVCGQIFCKNCCNEEIDAKLIGHNSRGHVRACNYCHKIVMSYINDRNSETNNLEINRENEFSQFREILMSQNLTNTYTDQMDSFHSRSEEHLMAHNSNSGLSHSSSFKRKYSVGFREEEYAKPKPIVLDMDKEVKQFGSASNSPMHTLSSFSVYKTPIKSINNCVTDNSPLRTEETSHEPLWVKEIHDEREETQSFERLDFDSSLEMNDNIENCGSSEAEDPAMYSSIPSSPRSLAYSSSTFDIELDFQKDRVSISKANKTIEKPVTETIKENKTAVNDEEVKCDEFVVTSTSSNWESLKEGSIEKVAYDALNSAYNQLYIKLLTQLLEDENLSLTWISVIQKISAKIGAVVRPNSHNDIEEMDVRNFVKIKTIPNGIKTDCQIINGIVFTKNIVHRKMRQTIVHPKILLLSCPIVYQRVEKKFTALDPILLQENEYIKNIVAKICSYKPDLILVEKTVTRIAQELLLANDITLVSNVKSIIIERISRFTGAAIVSSLDAQIGVPQLGICQKFFLQSFNQKTFMYFDGCPQQLGCTVLLRGGPIDELKKIKSICSFMVFSDFNWYLERSFLMDEYCMPSDNIDNQIEESIIAQNFDDSVTLRESPRKERNVGSIIIDDNSDPLRSMATKTCLKDVLSPIETVEIVESKENESNDLNTKMSQLMSKLQLNCSPFISTPLPYLMTTEGNKSKLRKFFSPQLVWSKRFENEILNNNELLKVEKSVNFGNHEQSSPVEIIPVKKHPFLLRELKSPANNNEIKSLISDFRARGPFQVINHNKINNSNVKVKDSAKKNEEQVQNKPLDSLNPKNHQHLPVLFSSFSYASTNAPNYCVKPWVVNMAFYAYNDIPLGGFLERYCFRSTYSCPSNACSTPMIEHVRRFVHSKGCVLIVLRQLQQNVEAAQSSIITWSWCQKCKTGTPYSHLSPDSWSLSFAKYLELKFYGSSYKRRATSSSVACNDHSLHKDHFQFFAFKHVVASFKYSPIDLYEIALPPTKIMIASNAFCRHTFIDILKQIAVKGYEIYSLILEKLCTIKDETNGTKYEIIVNEFMAIETRERGNFRQKIEEIQLALTPPTTESGDSVDVYKLEDNISRLKKMIAESVHTWNIKIQDFMNNKKKEEKLSSKTSLQNNSFKLPEQSFRPIEDISSNNSTNDCAAILEEANINPRSLSISSAASFITSLDTVKQDITTERMKAYIEEHEKECQETLEALESMDIEGCDEKDENDFMPLKDDCISVSSYGYDVDTGITAGLGTCVEDQENYTVFNIESSDESKKLEENQPLLVSNNSSKVSTEPSKFNINVSQSIPIKSDSNAFTVKRMLKELISNPNNLAIDYPFSQNEHYLLPVHKEDVIVIVKDGDPGSIISYALSSSDYDKQMYEINRFSSSPSVKRKSTSVENETTSDPSVSKPNPVSHHIDIQFSDTTTKFYCCAYYAEQFRRFRSTIFDSTNGEELYIRSLTNCVPWKARGGKSGSTFCKTVNDRFILKEMSKPELESFLSIANFYFDYCTRAINESRPTLLAKIVGIYRTSYKNSSTNSAKKLYLLVMENLFYNCDITQKFDLKGSMRNRLVDTNSPNVKSDQIVLLDENLVKMTCDSPLYIQSHSKAVLRAAIDNDSLFLSSHSVMDYSLLVGIDEQNKEFVVGIIDYIRPYTWDKKIESVVKSVGGQGKLPTIVQPDLYRIRFCEAMEQYFLCVPDKWFSIVNCV